MNITVIGAPLVISLLLRSGLIFEDLDADLSQETHARSLLRIFQRCSLESSNLSLHVRGLAAKNSVQLSFARESQNSLSEQEDCKLSN